MSELQIRTNNHWRALLDWWDLTPEEMEDFSYLVPNWNQLCEDDKPDPTRYDAGRWEGVSFVRYCGHTYDLGEFEWISDVMCLHGPLFTKWDEYQSDSFFSGVVVRYDENYEQVQVGTYMS